MADGMALPCVTTNETLHCEQTHSEPRRGSPLELIPPGLRSRVSTVQLNWVSYAYCPNLTYLLSGSQKALFILLLVLETS